MEYPKVKSGKSYLLFAGLFLLFTLAPVLNLSGQVAVEAQGSSDLAGVNVAVYGGGHSDENYASRMAVVNLFEWMNATVETLSPTQVSTEGLDGYDIFVMPGISPYTVFSDEMGSPGLNIIQSFVEGGGAYFGIYGGYYFEWPNYGLFDVVMRVPATGVSSLVHLGGISVNHASTGPDLTAEPASYSTMRWGCGFFEATDDTPINVIASYPENNLPAMVTFRNGSGAVFLSSPHPEYEEGGTRDGTTRHDDLADPDTEWGLLLKVARWLINPTTFTPPPNTGGTTTEPPPLELVLLVGGLVVVIIAIVSIALFLKRRR